MSKASVFSLLPLLLAPVVALAATPSVTPLGSVSAVGTVLDTTVNTTADSSTVVVTLAYQHPIPTPIDSIYLDATVVFKQAGHGFPRNAGDDLPRCFWGTDQFSFLTGQHGPQHIRFTFTGSDSAMLVISEVANLARGTDENGLRVSTPQSAGTASGTGAGAKVSDLWEIWCGYDGNPVFSWGTILTQHGAGDTPGTWYYADRVSGRYARVPMSTGQRVSWGSVTLEEGYGCHQLTAEGDGLGSVSDSAFTSRPYAFLAGVWCVPAGTVAAAPQGRPTGRLSLRLVGSNPFLRQTRLEYELPKAGSALLALYSVSGQTVRTLVHAEVAEGVHTAVVDAHGLAAGIYLLRLESAGMSVSRRIMVLH